MQNPTEKQYQVLARSFGHVILCEGVTAEELKKRSELEKISWARGTTNHSWLSKYPEYGMLPSGESWHLPCQKKTTKKQKKEPIIFI